MKSQKAERNSEKRDTGKGARWAEAKAVCQMDSVELSDTIV